MIIRSESGTPPTIHKRGKLIDWKRTLSSMQAGDSIEFDSRAQASSVAFRFGGQKAGLLVQGMPDGKYRLWKTDPASEARATFQPLLKFIILKRHEGKGKAPEWIIPVEKITSVQITPAAIKIYGAWPIEDMWEIKAEEEMWLEVLSQLQLAGFPVDLPAPPVEAVWVAPDDVLELRRYVVASGPVHDDHCSCDDTCECGWKPTLAAVERICNAVPGRQVGR